jgi:hypothetical protein
VLIPPRFCTFKNQQNFVSKPDRFSLGIGFQTKMFTLFQIGFFVCLLTVPESILSCYCPICYVIQRQMRLPWDNCTCQYSILRLGYTLGSLEFGPKSGPSSPESSLCVGDPSKRGKFIDLDERPQRPRPALLSFMNSLLEWRSSRLWGFGSSRFRFGACCREKPTF